MTENQAWSKPSCNLNRIGVSIGKYSNDDNSTIELSYGHRKNTIYYVHNNHGNADRWKIRMFIPHSNSSINSPKQQFNLCLKLEGNSLKKLKPTTKSNHHHDDNNTKQYHDDFKIVEFIYSNPTKSISQPHSLIVQNAQNKEYVSLFQFYVFAQQCTTTLYLPNFWDLFVTVSFSIYLTSEQKRNDLYLFWSAMFKCCENDACNEMYSKMYLKKNFTNEILEMCRNILRVDEEDYWKYPFESPYFLLWFVFINPQVVDGLMQSTSELFVSYFNERFVSSCNQKAGEQNIISQTLKLITEFELVEKFNLEKDKHFETIKRTAMPIASHMASMGPHPENTHLFKAVIELLNCIDPQEEEIMNSYEIEESYNGLSSCCASVIAKLLKR